MSLREKLEGWVFQRDLKHAKKAFEKVAKKADELRMPKKEKRGLFKLMLRAAGYRKIRIKERLY